jgi:hypothetical protein
MIEKLTAEQEGRFDEFVQKWTKIGTDITPINHADAEGIIKQIYAKENLPAPHIVWCKSPIQMIEVVVLVNQMEGLIPVGDGTVTADTALLAYESVRPFRDYVDYKNQLNTEAKKTVKNNCCFGQHDAGWLSFYDYMREVLNLVEETKELIHLFDLAGVAHWWLPTEDVCWMSERPDFVRFDEENRLHSDVGPVIKYGDEFKIWSLHGVQVDEQIVMQPETQSIEQINTEQNAEIKRIRIERYGWEKYLVDTDAKVVDTRRNDIEGTKEALMHVEDIRVLICHCPSTGRVYAMEVPPTTKTCQEAQEYLWSGSSLLSSLGKINITGRS